MQKWEISVCERVKKLGREIAMKVITINCAKQSSTHHRSHCRIPTAIIVCSIEGLQILLVAVNWIHFADSELSPYNTFTSRPLYTCNVESKLPWLARLDEFPVDVLLIIFFLFMISRLARIAFATLGQDVLRSKRKSMKHFSWIRLNRMSSKNDAWREKEGNEGKIRFMKFSSSSFSFPYKMCVYVAALVFVRGRRAEEKRQIYACEIYCFSTSQNTHTLRCSFELFSAAHEKQQYSERRDEIKCLLGRRWKFLACYCILLIYYFSTLGEHFFPLANWNTNTTRISCEVRARYFKCFPRL